MDVEFGYQAINKIKKLIAINKMVNIDNNVKNIFALAYVNFLIGFSKR